MKTNVVLFDLDGTLTPPRKRITDKNKKKILDLLNYTRVGIVTGSTLGYVIEQVDLELFERGLEVFSCNGTEHWVYSGDSWKSQVPLMSMLDHVSGDWRQLHRILNSMQGDLMEVVPELPLTGQFISYRGSMVNWCPIGREAGDRDRKQFEEIDSKISLRAGTLSTLRERLHVLNKRLTVKLGGSTSFDIYPEGWDKSFVLRHFPSEAVWFVGDRCEPTGNDFELYEALVPFNRSFKVADHEQTASIIDEIMLSIGYFPEGYYAPPY
jgi:phosphomannomutase